MVYGGRSLKVLSEVEGSMVRRPIFGGRSSMVERCPVEAKVAGSSPVDHPIYWYSIRDNLISSTYSLN